MIQAPPCPPHSPRSDELEALIREARARQRKRWLGAAVVIAVLAGLAFGIESIVSARSSRLSTGGGPASAIESGNGCGVRGVGVRILSQAGVTLYREPGYYTYPNRGFPTIRCSGSTIWAVWFNGAGMMQEAYLGARSLDGGRSWNLVFTEGMYGPRAPYQLGSYLSVWRLHGPRAAYFVSTCAACSVGSLSGTVSLFVTKDAGRSFREYKVPSLTGFTPMRIRVSGDVVRIAAKRFALGLPPHANATIHVG